MHPVLGKPENKKLHIRSREILNNALNLEVIFYLLYKEYKFAVAQQQVYLRMSHKRKQQKENRIM
jgi:hypothetical protein